MRLPDFWTGLVFMVLGGLVAVRAQAFPEPAGAASPRLFPEILGAAMLIGGLAVALRGIAMARASGEPLFTTAMPHWLRAPRRVAAVLCIPLAILAYSFLAPVIGSLPVAVATIFVMSLLFEGRVLPALAIAVVVSVVVLAFFIEVMGVPLPLGPLGGWL